MMILQLILGVAIVAAASSSIILTRRDTDGKPSVYLTKLEGQQIYRLPSIPAGSKEDPARFITRHTNFNFRQPFLKIYSHHGQHYHFLCDAQSLTLPEVGKPKPGAVDHLWLPLATIMFDHGAPINAEAVHENVLTFSESKKFKRIIAETFGLQHILPPGLMEQILGEDSEDSEEEARKEGWRKPRRTASPPAPTPFKGRGHGQSLYGGYQELSQMRPARTIHAQPVNKVKTPAVRRSPTRQASPPATRRHPPATGRSIPSESRFAQRSLDNESRPRSATQDSRPAPRQNFGHGQVSRKERSTDDSRWPSSSSSRGKAPSSRTRTFEKKTTRPQGRRHRGKKSYSSSSSGSSGSLSENLDASK